MRSSLLSSRAFDNSRPCGTSKPRCFRLALVLILTTLALSPLTAFGQRTLKVPANQPPSEGHFLRFAGANAVELADSAAVATWDHPMTVEVWFRTDLASKPFNSIETRIQLFGTAHGIPRPLETANGLNGAVSSIPESLFVPGQSRVRPLLPFQRPPDPFQWIVHIDTKGKKQSMGIQTNQYGGGRHFPSALPRGWAHIALQIQPGTETGIVAFLNGEKQASLEFRLVMPQMKERPKGMNLILGAVESWDFAPSFHGDICAFRVSKAIRYEDGFEPPAQFIKDKDTDILLDFSKPSVESISDMSDNGHHGRLYGASWFSFEDEKPVFPNKEDKKRSPKPKNNLTASPKKPTEKQPK
jgi:hypothetical protein